MIEIMGKAGVLVAIVVLGYVVKRVGWVSASDFPVLTRILTRVTLPCALAVSFNNFDIRPDLLYMTGLAILIVVSQEFLGWWLGRRDGRQGQAFGVLNTGSSNIGLFAMPYLGAFLGPAGIVFASLYDIGNSFAAAGVAYSWSKTLTDDRPVTARSVVKIVFSSVVFDVYLILLILGLLHIKLAAPILAVASVVGNANTFLAMFAVGVGLEVALPKHKYMRALRHLAARYASGLAWSLVIWFLLPLDQTAKLVLILLQAAPLAAMMSGFTAEEGLDVESSTFITSVTVLVAIVAMPLIMMGLAPH